MMDAAGRRRGRRTLPPLLFLLVVFSACAVKTEPPRRGLLRRQIVSLAVGLAGIPYVYGGSDVDGFDCSGLVFYVYDCFGIRLPRAAGDQAGAKRTVSWRRASAGDILVFKLREGWHSAVYIGDERFVHAPNSGSWVRIEGMNDYWRRRLKRVVAVLPRGR